MNVIHAAHETRIENLCEAVGCALLIMTQGVAWGPGTDGYRACAMCTVCGVQKSGAKREFPNMTPHPGRKNAHKLHNPMCYHIIMHPKPSVVAGLSTATGGDDESDARKAKTCHDRQQRRATVLGRE